MFLPSAVTGQNLEPAGRAVAMTVTRASLSEIGRALSHQNQIATRHCIKRIDRFVGNHRVKLIEAMHGIVEWLSKPRKEIAGKHRLGGNSVHFIVLYWWLGWRGEQCLCFGLYIVMRIFIAHRTTLDMACCVRFAQWYPATVDVVILADRGFGRARWHANAIN
jgi:hypothetical protein